MPCDEALLYRVEQVLKILNPRKKEVAYGSCFMIGRHLLCAVTEKYLITRINPDKKEECLKIDGVEDFVYRNRSSEFWIKVSKEKLLYDNELLQWLDVSVEYGKYVKSDNYRKDFRTHRTIK
ncbi:MAG TPA: hypothetical protein PKW56_09885 [Clostridiales bacterium]|nr:hypothetical protein [Clostridiales bacterium]